jgi:hypothetical protein
MAIASNEHYSLHITLKQLVDKGSQPWVSTTERASRRSTLTIVALSLAILENKSRVPP